MFFCFFTIRNLKNNQFMMKAKYLLALTGIVGSLSLPITANAQKSAKATGKQPVDYVNPYIGAISHMLVPTYPTTHLPNSMMRVFPVSVMIIQLICIGGLPLIVTHHRSKLQALIFMLTRG
jgi:hypothetical protein